MFLLHLQTSDTKAGRELTVQKSEDGPRLSWAKLEIL